ncbi:hypothetical protein [Burkholderia pseudomultivorans]|uniref:hypothetical protein n=1 Tax=Burkholderia pseudomultivorans TaxID=1207504 RepID=UPI00075DDD7B|nr:hypothetical protein [Burkholderia pseudomultivorans]KWF11714.1 hypothetical protein WT55_11530 [Burkholderia pseudomultivorans]
MATRQFKKRHLLAVLLITLVLAVYFGWSRFPSLLSEVRAQAFPSPPSASEAEAFARQDALRYTSGEVCDEYRRWPVTYDFDAPVYTQTKYTLALLEALADIGFVTRKVVPNPDAGPVQFYPHERRVYDLAPRAKPYVRAQAGGTSKALCFGRYVYDGFTSLEADFFVGDSSDRSQINGSVYKDLTGSYRTDVRYSIRVASGFEDWANAIDMTLHGHKVRDAAEYGPYRRLGNLMFFGGYDQSNGRDRYVSLEYSGRGWKFAPKS